MTRITGPHVRAWRQWAGWDIPETARRLRRAAGDDRHIAAHDSLVRQIRHRERNNSGVSERYVLLYAARRWRPLTGTGPDRRWVQLF